VYAATHLVAALAEPDVAQNTSGRRSAIDRRTTPHVAYMPSDNANENWVEEIFAASHARSAKRCRQPTDAAAPR